MYEGYWLYGYIKVVVNIIYLMGFYIGTSWFYIMITKKSVTISIKETFLDEFDEWWEKEGYPNRSEAVEELLMQIFELRKANIEMVEIIILQIRFLMKHPEKLEKFREFMLER